MPELPDVELYKRHLDEHALRRTIAGGRGQRRADPGRPAGRDLRRQAEGQPLRGFPAPRQASPGPAAQRWLADAALRHDRQSRLFREEADDPPYDRVRFDFKDGGHLAYVNRRMLGRVGLADDAEEFIEAEELGPDALDPAFDLQAFDRAIAGRRRDVKSVLMDQTLIAGIGNIYADEILFQARLHPKTPVTSLDDRQRGELFAQIKAVLANGDRVRRGRRAVSRAPAREAICSRTATKAASARAAAARIATLEIRRPDLLLLPPLPAGALTQVLSRSD